MLLKALSTTFGLPWGLDLSQLGIYSDFLYPALFLCSVVAIEWLGLPLGAKFPLVPKIQAGQKCQFCDQYYLSMVLVMPKRRSSGWAGKGSTCTLVVEHSAVIQECRSHRS